MSDNYTIMGCQDAYRPQTPSLTLTTGQGSSVARTKMKAAVILYLLALSVVKGDIVEEVKKRFNWNSIGTDEGSNSRGAPSQDNVCLTDQAACGCCLMHQQIQRMKRDFDEGFTELKQALAKANEDLNQFRSDRTAFSVALVPTQANGYYGPFRDETDIMYKHVFLNMGNHYDTSTGVFLVPRTGVYSLALTVYSDAKGPGNTLKACASLKVDGRVLSMLREFYLQDQEDSASSSLVLRLVRGQKVWVSLPTGCFLYDDGSHYNTFSVFMLYTTE